MRSSTGIAPVRTDRADRADRRIRETLSNPQSSLLRAHSVGPSAHSPSRRAVAFQREPISFIPEHPVLGTGGRRVDLWACIWSPGPQGASGEPDASACPDSGQVGGGLMNRFSRSAAWWRGAIGAMLSISLLASGLAPIAADAAIAPQTVSNAHNGASTSLTISKPTGVAVGDLLLAEVTFEKGSDAGSNTHHPGRVDADRSHEPEHRYRPGDLLQGRACCRRDSHWVHVEPSVRA